MVNITVTLDRENTILESSANNLTSEEESLLTWIPQSLEFRDQTYFLKGDQAYWGGTINGENYPGALRTLIYSPFSE